MPILRRLVEWITGYPSIICREEKSPIVHCEAVLLWDFLAKRLPKLPQITRNCLDARFYCQA